MCGKFYETHSNKPEMNAVQSGYEGGFYHVLCLHDVNLTLHLDTLERIASVKTTSTSL